MLVLATFFALTPIASGADPVGDFVNVYLKKKQIPGYAVMVRHHGKVALAAVTALPISRMAFA